MQGMFHLRGADNFTASRQALGALYGLLQVHATMLAFVEAFWVMGVVFLLMLPFVFLMRYKKHEKPSSAVSSPEVPVKCAKSSLHKQEEKEVDLELLHS